MDTWRCHPGGDNGEDDEQVPGTRVLPAALAKGRSDSRTRSPRGARPSSVCAFLSAHLLLLRITLMLTIL